MAMAAGIRKVCLYSTFCQQGRSKVDTSLRPFTSLQDGKYLQRKLNSRLRTRSFTVAVKDRNTSEMAALGSLTFWCGSEKVVGEAHQFFTEVLKCEPIQPPALKKMDGYTQLDTYSASFYLDGVQVEFRSYPIVSRIRKLLSFPARCGLLSVGISNTSMNEDGADLMSRSSMLLLSFTNFPKVSPIVTESKTLDAEVGKVNQIASLKEVALGVDEDKLNHTLSVLYPISSETVSPSARKLVCSTFSSMETYTNVRVIPGNISTIILRVKDRKQFMEQYFDFDYSSLFTLAEIGKTGAHHGDTSVQLHNILGLDLRISDTKETQAFFYEMPIASEEDTAKFGGRTDMGNMSCVSVVGMEGKERMTRIPASLVKKFSRL
mmetsp:Transcript_14298/g.18770  ORF Transcript_14298/g.18770 Transcript_14298/m.18770 type:complete len:377 (-) Transcript_14298:3028-4158(-)